MAAMSGRCLCGALRYRLEGEIRDRCYCHCQTCRRAAGSVAVAWGTVDAANFSITTGELTLFRSSPEVERGFCARCGTTLTYQHAEHANEIDFTLASLEEAESVAPVDHVWIQHKLSWVHLNDELPQHAAARERLR